MKVKYLDSCEYNNWDKFVSQNTKGTIFHKTIWFKNQLGDFRVLTIQQESIIIGGFAFLISKKAGIKGVFRPPYTPYFHPLIFEFSKEGNSEKEIEVLNIILNEIKKFNISLIFDSNSKYLYPYQSKGYKITSKLNYKIRPSLFLESISKRKITNINKYKKLLISNEINIVKTKNINDLIDLWENFGKDKLMNTYSNFLRKTFLNNSKFENWNCIKIYTNEKKFLAAGLYLFDDKNLYNIIPIVNYSILEKKEKNVGDFLYFKLIEIAEEKKLIFDFEGSEVLGVEKMYRRLGGNIDLKHTATKYDLKLNTVYFLMNFYKNIKHIFNK